LDAQHVVEQVGEKVGVFEITQNQQINYHSDNQVHALLVRFFRVANQYCLIKIKNGGENQDDYKQAAGFVVEKQARKGQK
jgi:hypothetical protein